MKKFMATVLAATLCLFITACSSNNVNVLVESESPASISQATTSAPPQSSAPQSPASISQTTPVLPSQSSSTLEVSQQEPVPTIPLHSQHIIDSGHFEGSYVGHVTRDTPMFTTYINTAIKMIYHFDQQVERDFFIGVSRPLSEHPDVLMEAHGSYDRLVMGVIDSSGEEWVKEQANLRIDELALRYQEWDKSMKEYYSVEEYEQYLIDRDKYGKSNEEFLRNSMGDDYEKSFGSYNSDDMEFWPVEYIVAGRLFRGLQINTVEPASGFYSGTTYLYCQIDNITIVISITSDEQMAGIPAKKHVNRFNVIS